MSKLPLFTRMLSSKVSRKMIQQFADKHGFVYFGYVSQRSDEHHIVRGMTVSTRHIDDHYCIGTFDEYDVVFVERSDTLQNGKRHMWHIIEFDLKHQGNLPHCLVGSPSTGTGFHELLSLKYPSLTKVQLGATADYPEEFQSHFAVYTAPAHISDIEQIIAPDVSKKIAQHFRGLVIELTSNALYVYSEKKHIDIELLDVMLQNGVWLAEIIDKK